MIEQVLAEPVVRQPVSLSFDERGRIWVVQYLQYPDPGRVKDDEPRQRLARRLRQSAAAAAASLSRRWTRSRIHEDTDGDGVFDRHKTFVEGLNIVTSVARGRGGVWVMNPPYLLFYPDKNNDDVPDGDPEVRLSGFGLEDTHSVANSLRWGPDGWLYGCQGSTVTANIMVYGADGQPTQRKPIYSQGQNIWRYHPETRRYEVFAEGGGNAFGLEIDAKGRIFSGHNGGNTRGLSLHAGRRICRRDSRNTGRCPIPTPSAISRRCRTTRRNDSPIRSSSTMGARCRRAIKASCSGSSRCRAAWSSARSSRTTPLSGRRTSATRSPRPINGFGPSTSSSVRTARFTSPTGTTARSIITAITKARSTRTTAASIA